MQYIYYGNTLYHHGIKGQKWGVRRFQNDDGSLTPAGRERYGKIGHVINTMGQIGNRRYTSNGETIKYRRRDEKSFHDEKSSIKKGVRTAIAVSSGGLGRSLSRFAYNHRQGLRNADAVLTGLGIGLSVSTMGVAGLPAAAFAAGKVIVKHYAAEKLNDAIYENLYLKDKDSIKKKYRNTKKYGDG